MNNLNKHIINVIFIFSIITFCTGQNSNLDNEMFKCLKGGYSPQICLECIEEVLNEECTGKEVTPAVKGTGLLRASNICVQFGAFPQAEYYVNAALEIVTHHFSIESIEYLKTLGHLAYVKRTQGDISGALILREKSELIAQRLADTIHLLYNWQTAFFDNRTSLASLYQLMGRKKDVLDLYERVENIRESSGYMGNLNRFHSDLQWANSMYLLGEEREALQIGEGLIQGAKSYCITRGEACRLYLYALVLQAEIYLSVEKVAEAQALIQEANKYVPKHQSINMDELYLRTVELRAEVADKEFLQLEEQALYIIKGATALKAIDPGSMTQVYTEVANAYLQRGLHLKHKEDIQQAYEYIKEGMSYWNQLSRTSPNQDDIRYSLQEYYRLFEVGFNVLYELKRHFPDDTTILRTALQYFEATKNIELRTSLRRAIIAEELGVPSHLLQRQQKWNQDIFALNLKIDQEADLSTAERLTLEEERNILKRKLNDLEEKLLREYPAYVNRLNQNTELDELALNSQLEATNQSIVYLLAADHHLFTITLSPYGQAFYRFDISRDSLAILVDEVRDLVYESPHEPSKAGLDQLAHLSHQLYQILLAPVDSLLTKRLVIIPDGPTEILPFSLLLTEETDHTQSLAEWPFLIREHSLSYAYGLELWMQQLERNTETTAKHKRILAFAPTFSTTALREENLRAEGDLTYNQAEVDYIADRFPAQTYLAEEARLPYFRAHASDYSILHLATHASANTEVGEYSYLSFAPIDSFDHHLEVGELYNMTIPAELVVLSACETGIGEWQRGEGVIGLERAFAFAGAESLITTHWRVSDRASSDFMSGFYAQLANDLPKDEALRQAQLAFIAEHEDWLAHPFYWAAYVQKGNTDSIPVAHRRHWGYWLGAGLVLLLIGNRFYRKKQHAS